MKKNLLISAAISAALVATPTMASAEAVGDIQQISNLTPADGSWCGQTSTAFNPESGVTMAGWVDTLPDDAFGTIQVTPLTADGSGGTVEQYRNSEAGVPLAFNDCATVTLTAGADGNFLAVWETPNEDKLNGIFVDSNGQFIGDYFTVSSNTNYYGIETSNAAWSELNQQYLVTWSVQTANNFGLNQRIVGRLLDASGAPVGDDFVLTDDHTVNNSQQTVAGNGIWVTVYQYNGNYPYYEVTTANGEEEIESSASAVDATASGTSIAYNAELDQFLITWKGTNRSARILDGTGAPIGDDILLNEENNGGKPVVTDIGAKGWLVAWHNQPDDNEDIIAVEVAADGTVGTSEIVSADLDDTIENNLRPALAYSPVSGLAYVVWTRYIAADAASNVVTRAWFVTEGTPLEEEVAEEELAATGIDAGTLTVGAFALMFAAVATAAVRRRSVR